MGDDLAPPVAGEHGGRLAHPLEALGVAPLGCREKLGHRGLMGTVGGLGSGDLLDTEHSRAFYPLGYILGYTTPERAPGFPAGNPLRSNVPGPGIEPGQGVPPSGF